MSGKEKKLIVLGIIFISFNLRAPITAVGSIVEMIKSEFMISSSSAGLITTLPLIAFAIVSPFVSKTSKKLGYGKTMMLGLMFILLGELVRSYTNLTGLFIGTALLGIGIAIGNVLIPSIIKMSFPNKTGLLTSIYTSSMCIFAAVGAGLSIPLAKGLNLGWKNALAIWFTLTLVTIIIWLPQLKAKDNMDKTVSKKTENKSIWKSSTAWWVTLFMGTQSLLFYSLVAWLPTIIVSKGMTESFAGTMALTFQLIAIPATLLIPILCDKLKNQRILVGIVCGLYISGMLLLFFAKTNTLLLGSVVLMSLGMGGSISLSIAFISLRSQNSSIAAELSGMSQSAGYLLAAVGPILMGYIYDSSGSWSLPITIFAGLIVFLSFCGWYAGNNVVIEEEEEHIVTYSEI